MADEARLTSLGMDRLTHAQVLIENASAILKRRTADPGVDEDLLERARIRIEEAIVAVNTLIIERDAHVRAHWR